MSIKNTSRLRRAKKTRMNIKSQETPRLSVYRSSKHFYAQVFDSLGTTVIASASTVEKDME
jgi:large subunit ribosomal protein L18